MLRFSKLTENELLQLQDDLENIYILKKNNRSLYIYIYLYIYEKQILVVYTFHIHQRMNECVYISKCFSGFFAESSGPEQRS